MTSSAQWSMCGAPDSFTGIAISAPADLFRYISRYKATAETPGAAAERPRIRTARTKRATLAVDYGRARVTSVTGR